MDVSKNQNGMTNLCSIMKQNNTNENYETK